LIYMMVTYFIVTFPSPPNAIRIWAATFPPVAERLQVHLTPLCSDLSEAKT
jgi:hypothetical protein